MIGTTEHSNAAKKLQFLSSPLEELLLNSEILISSKLNLLVELWLWAWWILQQYFKVLSSSVARYYVKRSNECCTRISFTCVIMRKSHERSSCSGLGRSFTDILWKLRERSENRKRSVALYTVKSVCRSQDFMNTTSLELAKQHLHR